MKDGTIVFFESPYAYYKNVRHRTNRSHKQKGEGEERKNQRRVQVCSSILGQLQIKKAMQLLYCKPLFNNLSMSLNRA